MIEAGYYWAQTGEIRQIIKVCSDGRQFLHGISGPRFDLELLPGPLKFEPEAPKQPDPSLMAALAAATRANVEMAANLTATQARCTELLDESRAKGREITTLKNEINHLVFDCRNQTAKLEAERAKLKEVREGLTRQLEAERRAKTEAQAQTIQRLRAIGYRVVKRCGACVTLAFEK